MQNGKYVYLYLLKPTVASLLANSQATDIPNASLSAVDQADNLWKLCKQINHLCHIAGEMQIQNITTMYQASQTECAIFSSRQTYPHDVLLSGRDRETITPSHSTSVLVFWVSQAWEPPDYPIKTLNLWQKACCLGHHLVMKNTTSNVTYGKNKGNERDTTPL